jgi:uncharacterized protein
MGRSSMAIAATYAIIFFSAFVHGLLGIGFPLLATPLLALTSDVRTAVVLLLLPTMAINVVNVIHGGHWRESIGRFWPLALFGAIGSLIGTQLLVLTDPAPYKLLLAGVIMVYLNIHRIGLRLQWIRQHVTLACVLFGLVGGLLAGTVNVMVPALIIFALELRLAPLITVQVFNFCFFFGKLSQGVILASHGYLDGPQILSAAPYTGAALLALWLGIRWRKRIAAEVYRLWLRRILAVITILLILQYAAIYY